jgi:hypothetical protein
MLQGDDLSVQLFIGALAVNVLGVAMTQAGWTHRWFVRGMFALAAVLAIAAAGWRYIEARIPLLDGALQTATSSRVVWFVAGTVPALIAGMLINGLLRRRRESDVKVLPPGWMSVGKAMRRFARQHLLDRDAYVLEQLMHNAEEATVLHAQIAELENTRRTSRT